MAAPVVGGVQASGTTYGGVHHSGVQTPRSFDMQFTPQAIVRDWDRDVPKPYSRNFHASLQFSYRLHQVSRILRAGADFAGN